MTISLIAAMTRKGRVIGRNGTLPWHLPGDLQHFKQLTMGKSILMGRKTFSSIGRALPGRRNLVLSRKASFEARGCEVFATIAAALAAIKQSDELMVIGGATIYEQLLPCADYMHLTLVEAELSGDTYFPAWKETDWQLITETRHAANSSHAYDYSFLKLKRKESTV